MQDHKQHRDDKSINQLDIVLNIHRIPTNTTCSMIGSSQAHGGEDIYLAIAMDP
jgi:hypothetical protein